MLTYSKVTKSMSNKKNILFITTYNPYLQKTGAHQRTHHIFEALRQYGNVDTLFFNLYDQDTIVEDKSINNHIIDLRNDLISKISSCINFFNQNIINPTNKKCKQLYNDTIQRKHYDFIVFRYLPTAVMCGVKDYSNVIIDIDDIPWHNYYRMAQNPTYPWIQRIYFQFKYKGIKKQSLKIMSDCKLYYTANPQDCLTSNSHYLPNIPSHIEEINYIPTPNKNILFVGFMAFPPNYQGVDYFIKNVWNKIIEKHSDASFYIAGKGTPEYLKSEWEKYPNTHVLGYVDDLKALYEKCFIVVSPIYSGAGTNIKVLEALAMKKVCVISQFAFKGFEQHFTHGEEILIAKSNNEYIQLLDNVLNNLDKYTSIAIKGFQLILSNYTINNIQVIIKQTLLP